MKNNDLYDADTYDQDLISTTWKSLICHGMTSGCVIVCIMLALWCLISAIHGEISRTVLFCTSCLIAGISGGMLHRMCFVWQPALRFSYPTRLIAFFVIYFFVLLGCGVLGTWFSDGGNAGFMQFILAYTTMFVATSIGASIFSYKRKKEYNKKLAAWKKEH